MKKIINLFLVMFLVMGLTACDTSKTYSIDDANNMLEVIPVTADNINDYLEWYEYQWTEKIETGYTGTMGRIYAIKLKDGYAANQSPDDVAINYSYEFNQNGKIVSGDDGKATIPFSLLYEAANSNSGGRSCDIFSIDELFAYGDITVLETELVSFEITSAEGNIYNANIPDEAWVETTEDIGDFTAKELGRHITFKNDNDAEIVVYENGVFSVYSNGELQGYNRCTNVTYALLMITLFGASL